MLWTLLEMLCPWQQHAGKHCLTFRTALARGRNAGEASSMLWTALACRSLTGRGKEARLCQAWQVVGP